MLTISSVQKAPSPIILDDFYDLAETLSPGLGDEHYEGLWGQGSCRAALLSMSGYGKAPPDDGNGEWYKAEPSCSVLCCLALIDNDHVRAITRLTMAL